MGPAAIPILAVGTVLQFAGQMAQADAAKAAGRDAQIMADYRARQQDQAAGQEIAASQRGAAEERRRAQLVASRALAVAGASGGDVSDPTVQNLLADLEGEGAYRASLALYQGEDRARQLKQGSLTSIAEGDLAMSQGKSKAKAYQTSAFGNLFANGAGLYSKYGGGGVKAEQLPAPVEDRFFN